MKTTSFVLAASALVYANVGISGDAGSLDDRYIQDPIDQGETYVGQDPAYKPGQDLEYAPGQDVEYKPGQDYGYQPGLYTGRYRTLRCSSSGYGLQRCYLGAGFYPRRVQLLEQHSSAGCIRGSSWGVRGNYIWVNRGCRGTFAIY